MQAQKQQNRTKTNDIKLTQQQQKRQTGTLKLYFKDFSIGLIPNPRKPDRHIVHHEIAKSQASSQSKNK
jgi:hypothetical protein